MYVRISKEVYEKLLTCMAISWKRGLEGGGDCWGGGGGFKCFVFNVVWSILWWYDAFEALELWMVWMLLKLFELWMVWSYSRWEKELVEMLWVDSCLINDTLLVYPKKKKLLSSFIYFSICPFCIRTNI